LGKKIETLTFSRILQLQKSVGVKDFVLQKFSSRTNCAALNKGYGVASSFEVMSGSRKKTIGTIRSFGSLEALMFRL
jgi:hypothetical protein